MSTFCRLSRTLLLVNPATETARADSRTLVASLAPVLAQACEGRLGEIIWFKTDWQRGGAATGKSTFRLDDGDAFPVVLKLPIVQRELLWMQRLQTWRRSDGASPFPRLLAGGETLGGYDLAWMVIERFAHGPLGLHWHDDHVPRIAQAAAAFYAAATNFPVDQPPRFEEWHELLRESAESVKVNHIAHEQRWAAAIKTMRGRLDRLLLDWSARECSQWLHGDLHLANAMSRVSLQAGPVCLIDLAEVHAGHWVEDAIYLERQLWAKPERLKIHKPVKAIAAARKQIGLGVEGDYPRLAMIRRALLAGTAPRFMKSEGHPAYMDACLTWLEIAMNELK